MAAASPFPSMSDHGLNRHLFNALKDKNTDEVIQLCQIAPDGPLHRTGIHKDTVLHLACYSKQKDLAVKLVRLLTNNLNRRLTKFKNEVGNTLLHETATSNEMRDVATLLLAKDPKLLSAKNAQGETPLFRAARFGKIRLFKLLAKEVDKDNDEEMRKDQFHSEDKTSILHIAIIAEHFDLAMLIVEMYPELIGMEDGNGMTALQHLACNPSAFAGTTEYGLCQKLIYHCIPDKKRTMEECCDTKRNKDTKRYVKWILNLVMWKELKREKYKHASAWELAKELIKKDTSWEATENTALNKGKKSDQEITDGSSGLFLSGLLLKTERERLCITSKNSDEKQGQSRYDKMPKTTMTGIRRDETPLFLATSWRIKKLVEEILYNYPQAVEHVNKKGRNILHIAIQYRHLEIFEMVQGNDMLSRRLLRATDAKGNSLLHMVGKRRKGPKMETSEGPALDLRDQLAWFERVKKAVKSDFVQLFNHKNQTADDLFTKNYSTLHEESRKWLEETSKNCTIVAVLIATVAFTAAYTVPGGNLSSGMPVLLSQPFFVVFTLADVFSLTLALTSVVSFLTILTSPFRLQDFRVSLPRKLTLALSFLILSVSMMMLAFAATIILMINTKQSWTKISLYSAALVPVLFFAYSFSPLCLQLVKTWSFRSDHFAKNYPDRKGGRKNPNQYPLDRPQRSGCQITEV